MVYYFYIFCISPIYSLTKIDDFTLDLILNYHLYFNNYVPLTKFYEYDWLIYLEFQELTSDKYFYIPKLFENEYLLGSISLFKFISVFLIKLYSYFIFFIFFTKIVVVNFFAHSGYQTLNQFYFEHEHNVGDGEDLLMIISFVLSIVVFNICYFYLKATNMELNIILLVVVIVFILIPFRIILSFGSSFINFIKGASTSNKFSLELFNDSMMLFVFLVRFSLQSIRIILVYIFYFSIHEYVFILPKDYITNLNASIENWGPNLFSKSLDFLRWVIELVDSTVSICNQLASFFFVIFWLFSYINTFELKRNKLFWFEKLIIKIDITEASSNGFTFTPTSFFMIKTV